MWLEDPRPGLATLPSADFYGFALGVAAGAAESEWLRGHLLLSVHPIHGPVDPIAQLLDIAHLELE